MYECVYLCVFVPSDQRQRQKDDAISTVAQINGMNFGVTVCASMNRRKSICCLCEHRIYMQSLSTYFISFSVTPPNTTFTLCVCIVPAGVSVYICVFVYEVDELSHF